MSVTAGRGRPADTVAATTRRRGEHLRQAIFDAVFEQLRTVGFGAMTMESVAQAAGTGKAALYRRWSNKADLVTDALCQTLPAPADVVVHDDVREDILALLRLQRDVAMLGQSAALHLGTTVPDQNAALFHDVVRQRFSLPSLEMIVKVLERGAERGEVRQSAATMMIARIGPAMVVHAYLSQDPELTDDFLAAIVDDVVLPIARVPESTPSHMSH